eukprot:snap_masked-scaffold_2-processed-gene-8.19-mRNA-1 protein AED:1.00 eAED:1.00 QI:0/-1/0/0/-1/1/1/0/271
MVTNTSYISHDQEFSTQNQDEIPLRRQTHGSQSSFSTIDTRSSSTHRKSYLERLSSSVERNQTFRMKHRHSESVPVNGSFSETVKEMLKNGFSLKEVKKISNDLLGTDTTIKQNNIETNKVEERSNEEFYGEDMYRNNSLYVPPSFNIFPNKLQENDYPQEIRRLKSYNSMSSFTSSTNLFPDSPMQSYKQTQVAQPMASNQPNQLKRGLSRTASLNFFDPNYLPGNTNNLVNPFGNQNMRTPQGETLLQNPYAFDRFRGRFTGNVKRTKT